MTFCSSRENALVVPCAGRLQQTAQQLVSLSSRGTIRVEAVMRMVYYTTSVERSVGYVGCTGCTGAEGDDDLLYE